MFRNIFFDWSGTLADDLPPVLDATNRVLAHHGRPHLSMQEFRDTFRLPFKGFYDEVLPEIPLEDLEVLFSGYFSASAEPIVLLPHARAFLEFCQSKGTRMFILSSARRDFLEAQASDLGVLHFFETIHAGVLDKREALPGILASHGLDPASTAFIGDMEHDVETALASGVHAIAVLTGYDPPAKLVQAGPDVVVTDLGRLQYLLSIAGQHPAAARPDTIRIDGLEVTCHIGAGAEERATPQMLRLDITMVPAGGLHGLADDLGKTIDYHAVALAIQHLAAAKPRRLVESLAEDVLDLLERDFHITRASVRVRKFILPFVESVGVSMQRPRLLNQSGPAATL